MSVQVTTIDDNTIEVNGKSVTLDLNDNWITQEELAPSEARSVRQHIKSLKREKHCNG